MKTRWIQLIAGFTMVVLCISIYPASVNATVVWSDDFNDGDYNGWTICDNSTLLGGGWGFNGSTWDATNYYLEVTDAPDTWGIISHPSDVANGTWSFDFKDDDFQSRAADTAMVVFMSGNFYDWDDFYEDANFYWIDFDVYSSENYTVGLKKRSGSVITPIASADVPAAGWHNFDVTRNTTGEFKVYHNGAPIMEGLDTEFNTSDQFWLWFKTEIMIDNVLVDDELNPRHFPTTTTTTPNGTEPPWDLILIASGVAVVVIALVVVVVKRR